MRKMSLFIGDIRFQFKYGFYFIYLVFTLIYIALIYTFPPYWRHTAGILMIFSDPAEIGLYFMGAIVLFEKSEKVLNSLAVSPVSPTEYVLSKLCSLAVISTIVASVIGFGAGIVRNAAVFLLSVFFCSCLFSAVGLIISSKISTLNGFIIATILPQLIINIPAFFWLFGYRKNWLLFHPGVGMMELCADGLYAPMSLLVLILWTVFFTVLAISSTRKMFRKVGGEKP
ncbi:MAG: ABC transporter permease [Bacillota bacterium]|nr:ABC transporter permease [Bacillota bacterium]